jgi:hypothetical protein
LNPSLVYEREPAPNLKRFSATFKDSSVAARMRADMRFKTGRETLGGTVPELQWSLPRMPHIQLNFLKYIIF